MLVQRLQRFEPFASADPAERSIVAQHARLLVLPAGRCFVAGARRAPGSWFLCKGTVQLRANDGTLVRVTHECAAARRPLIDDTGDLPGVRVATTISQVELLYVDLAPIAFLLDRRALPTYPVTEVGSRDAHWAHRFLAGGFARRLPPVVLQRLFRAFERTPFTAGERVVAQGDPGDAFYVIQQGRVRVSQGGFATDLVAGDTFGADAIVAGAARNATVRMATDGALAALPAARFRQLIETPLIARTDKAPRESVPLSAERLPAAGVALRGALATLDAARTYAVFGKDEARVRLTVYLLRERGVDAVWVE
jgi:CRP-like cAMP-binding protein